MSAVVSISVPRRVRLREQQTLWQDGIERGGASKTVRSQAEPGNEVIAAREYVERACNGRGLHRNVYLDR